MAEPTTQLSPELIVHAYSVGAFPMAESRGDDAIAWYSPDPRAILPLGTPQDHALGASFHVRRSLAKRMRRGGYVVTRDQAFDQVVRGCAAPRPYTDETWINPEIMSVFSELHSHGIAHSVELWSEPTADEPRELLGGLYGLALGGAFFAESMFSRIPDASSICLVSLVDHLRQQGFTLLDVQFVNDHLLQFGVTEIRRDDYLARLEAALRSEAGWLAGEGG